MTSPVQAGGHGGELLRGGYAQRAWRTRQGRPASLLARGRMTAGSGELFRRLTTRRLGLLRRGVARAYLGSLTPSIAALSRGPLRALDDFYLANRAGRWSAAARQAYLIRSPLAQPLFDERVVSAARAVSLQERLSDEVHRGVLKTLCPDLLAIPLANGKWRSGQQPPALPALRSMTPPPDWRRGPGTIAVLRDYALDHGPALFTMVRRSAAERALRAEDADPGIAWALATVAALVSGDWLNARVGAGPAALPSSGPSAEPSSAADGR